MSDLPRLAYSANRRFLITEGGQPFFWLGDTAWELVHRLKRSEIDLYCKNRAAKGFNVVQTVALAELDGLHTPNAYGHLPFVGDDPAKPDEGYFQDLDYVLLTAAEHGLYVALLPTWADKVTPNWGAGPAIFNPKNAYKYARFLAKRYEAHHHLIWVLGGDRPQFKDSVDWSPIWREMARGIRDILGSRALLTYHPDGGPATPSTIHREPWADLVMLQSGHWAAENPAWDWLESLYQLEPAKPVLDAEPCYEDHPIAPWPKWNPESGYFRDYEVRKQCYRSVFAGGCGVTYGHHFIWQMWEPGRAPVNNGAELMPWKEAMDRPGAAQMIHLKRLMLSRPYLGRIPDQGLIDGATGSQGSHVRATRDGEGRYAMIYVPDARREIRCHLERLAPRLRAWWFDPRSGAANLIREGLVERRATFVSPSDGPDWVLVLDDESQEFGAPGDGPD